MKEFLVGKTVCWGGLDPCPHQAGRPPGVGTVLAMKKHTVLVRTLPYFPDDFEPAHMLVLALFDPTLLFFDSADDWKLWQHWLDTNTGDAGDVKIITFRPH